jgi:hypothetical protein
MSYDVSIGDFSANYTSNVSGLWYDHIAGDEGLRTLDGLTGREAFAILADATDSIYRMHSGTPAAVEKYNPANGWGSMVGALLYHSRIMAACARHPRKKVRVSA